MRGENPECSREACWQVIPSTVDRPYKLSLLDIVGGSNVLMCFTDVTINDFQVCFYDLTSPDSHLSAK